MELSIDVIKWAWCCLVADRRTHRFAADNPLQPHASHQPCNGAAGHAKALPLHLTPDFTHAIDAEIVLKHTPDFGLQGHVTTGTSRQTRGISLLGTIQIIGGWGDRQNAADRLDPVVRPVIVDKRDHFLNGRSSSVPLPGR